VLFGVQSRVQPPHRLPPRLKRGGLCSWRPCFVLLAVRLPTTVSWECGGGDLDYSSATVPLLGGVAGEDVLSFIYIFSLEVHSFSGSEAADVDCARG
jgi:hypothetical protein